jgi:hypothetical protein
VWPTCSGGGVEGIRREWRWGRRDGGRCPHEVAVGWKGLGGSGGGREGLGESAGGKGRSVRSHSNALTSAEVLRRPS